MDGMTTTDDHVARVTPRTSTGKLAVLAMIAVALVAATFAWWWNFNRGRKALEFYGPKAATLIRTAPKVELLTETGAIDISKEPGLLNARASLLSDASYRWNEPTESSEAADCAVRFSTVRDSVVVEFNFSTQSASNSSTNRSAKLAKKTSAGWEKFLARIFSNSVKVQ
jgi:hypothetical protein